MFPLKMTRTILLVSACALALLPAVGTARKNVEVDTITTANPVRPDKAGGSNPVPAASIEIACSGGGKIKISTGNDSGICTGNQNGGGASCALNGTQLVRASCSGGCTLVTGGGTCQVIN